MLLSNVIGSEARIKILLMLGAQKESYQGELQDALKLPLYAVQRQLEGLEKEGTVVRTEGGLRRTYRLNPNYPLYKELRALLRKANALTKKAKSKNR